MLMKMGWKGEGHGLGKFQQGMLDPIEPEQVAGRLGLGYDDYSQELNELDQVENLSKMTLESDNTVPYGLPQQKPPARKKPMRTGDLIKNIRKVLIQYTNSISDNDLVFDKSLSVDDRKLIHREAHKLGLKTRSEGAEHERFLVVRRKLTTSEIIESASKNGGQISRYQIVSKGD